MNSMPARSSSRASASDATGPKMSSGRGSGVTMVTSGPSGNSFAVAGRARRAAAASRSPAGARTGRASARRGWAASTSPALIGPRKVTAPGTPSTGARAGRDDEPVVRQPAAVGRADLVRVGIDRGEGALVPRDAELGQPVERHARRGLAAERRQHGGRALDELPGGASSSIATRSPASARSARTVSSAATPPPATRTRRGGCGGHAERPHGVGSAVSSRSSGWAVR